MKKKIKKQVRHTNSHKTLNSKASVPSARIIIVSSFFAVLLAIVFVANKHAISTSVLGTQIMKGAYNEATISWTPTSGAVAYNIYYRSVADICPPTTGECFTHAVRKIPSTVTSYTIQYLKHGLSYQYEVKALNAQGREMSPPVTPLSPLTNLVGM